MLLAYEKGAELIVAVGTHFNLIEFLERNRAGMSSTFLTRLGWGRSSSTRRACRGSSAGASACGRSSLFALAGLAAILVAILVSPTTAQLSTRSRTSSASAERVPRAASPHAGCCVSRTLKTRGAVSCHRRTRPARAVRAARAVRTCWALRRAAGRGGLVAGTAAAAHGAAWPRARWTVTAASRRGSLFRKPDERGR